jgi:quinol monooxygenase YgiN
VREQWRASGLAKEGTVIAVVATINVKEGKETEFEAVMMELAEKVRSSEPGTILYQVCKAKDAPTYVVLENYSDQDAFAHHTTTSYFKEATPKMGACMAGAPKIEFYEVIG